MAVLFRRDAPRQKIDLTAAGAVAGTRVQSASGSGSRTLSIEQIVQQRLVTAEFQPLKQSGRVPTQAQDSTVDALGTYLDSVVAAGVEPVAVVMCDGLGISGSAYGELRSLVQRSSLAVMLTHGEPARAIPKLHTHRLATTTRSRAR